jgi:hypothetical protein
MLFKITGPLMLVLVTACATAPSAKPDSVTSSATTTGPVYVTGSRIPVYESNSSSERAAAQSAQPTQTVGAQDIALTGQTDMNEALRLLVPAQH